MQDRQAEQLTCPHCGNTYAADDTRPPGYCSGMCRRSVRNQAAADRQTDWFRAVLVRDLIRDCWSDRELQTRCRPEWQAVTPQSQVVELAAVQATAEQ